MKDVVKGIARRKRIFGKPVAWESRDIARGIIEALTLWGTSHYARFLDASTPPEIDRRWFKRFLGEWRVARTIANNHRDQVREYFEGSFRFALQKDKSGESVDQAADYVKKQGWSSRTGKSKRPSRPISVVSKVGFFLAPKRIVPFDSLALSGLRRLRSKESSSAKRVLGASYVAYLRSFNVEYAQAKNQIEQELDSHWVGELAVRFGVKNRTLQSVEFRRKIFDSMLMSRARGFD